MKRIIAVLILGGITVAGAGAAWAQTTGSDRPARRAALRTCRQDARQADPGATRALLREAVKSCLAEQGILPKLSDAQKAAAKQCLQEAKATNPDADKVTIAAAARPCLEQAGIVKALTPEQQARRTKLLNCFEQAKAAHPGERAAIRQATRACMKTA